VRKTDDPMELELELFDLWDVANQGHLSFEVLILPSITCCEVAHGVLHIAARAALSGVY
jgi:hypothetical protein